jgi:hypothetical protein
LQSLRDLTNQHLKEIEVSLGHRRQLLRAIAELTRPREEGSEAGGHNRGIRFLRSSGSTALSARMDPEDLAIISALSEVHSPGGSTLCRAQMMILAVAPLPRANAAGL